MKRFLLTMGLVAVMPAASWADSISLRHRALRSQIDAARQRGQAGFQALASLKTAVPELDRVKRGRLAPVTPRLRALGAGALLAMLAELELEARGETLTGTALTAWRVGLLEAVGAIRDPRALPVLVRVLDRETGPAVVRAAAGALGELGNEEAVDLLVARATRLGGERQLALIAGMGQCRRLAAARALAGMLARRPSEALAEVLIKALGELGNAWAWQTPRLAALGEGAAVRALASGALLDAFIRYPGARQAAESAILLVDDPGTEKAIARARAAAPAALQAALKALADRVEHSPFRRGRPAK